MQGQLTAGDRKLLGWTGAVLAVLLAASVLVAPVQDEGLDAPPSSYSSSSAGARAAWLLIQELGYPARRWEQSVVDLPDPGRGVTLILAEPTQEPTEAERAAILRFVRSGGRILFCGGRVSSFVPAPPTAPGRYEWETFPTTYPSYVTRGVRTVAMRPQSAWVTLAPSQVALAGHDGRTTVASWAIGDGEVIWWAAGSPLTNGGVTRGDNLRLFLNSVNGPSGRPESVLWDEYFHGHQGSLWSYTRSTPIGWGVAQIGLLAAAILFTYARRRGPVMIAVEPVRLSPVEFVETMGGLYRRAGAAHVAVAIIGRRVRGELLRRLGLPLSASNQDAGSAARERFGVEGLGGALDQAERAADAPGITEAAALNAVRDIESFTLK